MSGVPFIGLKHPVAAGARLAVLDTNALLNIALDNAGKQQLLRDFADHVLVVPAIVHAELAGKTHPESYRRVDDRATRTISAARATATVMVPGGRWPTATGLTLALAYPTTAFWARLARQRLRETDASRSEWLTWSHDATGRSHSEPAMADHQVLLTAWGLQHDAYVVTLLTNDMALRQAARRFGVAVRTVAEPSRARA